MTTLTRDEILEKVQGWLTDARFCMLTTTEPGGGLHSRPMTMLDSEFDGSLWFFTAHNGPIVDAVRRRSAVCAAVQAEERSTYVSLSGHAHIVRDDARTAAFWKPAYKVFFPGGPHDPNLALLRVDIETIEFWDTPGGVVGFLFNLVKNLTSDQHSPIGEHAEIHL